MITSLTSRQINNIKKAVRSGLKTCERPVPLTLSEWADKNFYMSSESSYVEGRWETAPFQVAPMNSIGHPDIRVVNIIKSARVGYTKMLSAALGYFAEHKKRNQLIYQPTDSDASDFMKEHIEPMIRDVPVVRSISPWYGKKHRNNTLTSKRFDNAKKLWCFGGKASKNYREKSPDNVYYDELSGFDDDIEKEGSATLLGDKRLEGSAFPKSVRGSTPKVTGHCQISKAAEECECYFRMHLPCPHCTQEQVLKWGGPDCDYGMKWSEDDPKSVKYLCEHCATLIENQNLEQMQIDGFWKCDLTDTFTHDGVTYFDASGKRRDAPTSVTWHIWTAYSLFTSWASIVEGWNKSHKDRSKLKTFVNTTLGETWDDDEGEKLDEQTLYARREHYPAEIPVDRGIITCAVDTQDDRLEIEHVIWTHGEESYRISYERLYGDLSRSEIWRLLKSRVSRQFKTLDGHIIEARMCFIDSGGHYTDEVYKFCKKNGIRNYVPVKGHSQTGKPVVMWPRKRNDKGVYLAMIGTDTAKEIITDRLKQSEPGEGYMHYPVSEQFDEDYFKHLTNEKRVLKVKNGRRTYVWDAGGKRNEPFDTSVYNLAAIRALQQHFGVRLPQASAVIEEELEQAIKVQAQQAQQARPKNDFINYEGDWL